MAIELIDDSTYEIEHLSGVVFTMRDWTLGMQNEVDRACFTQDGKGGVQYQIAQAREMKINLAVVGWRGVQSKGAEVPCTAENKKKLPVGIALWIVTKVDERAGLSITEAEKKS